MPTLRLSRPSLFVPLAMVILGCRTEEIPLEPVQVPHSASVVPTPAPELQSIGGHIAFVTDRDGNFEIYVMNPDGTGQTNITNDPRPDFQPAWSPDGTRIAFSRIDNDGSQSLWVMNADGTGQVKLNQTDGGDPSWSPDGTRIAFTSVDASFTLFDVHVINADGTGEVAITTDPAADFSPAWSPDGAWIEFSSNREKTVGGFNHTSLYLVRPDGSEVTPLTTMSGAEFIAKWAPNGNSLVLVHNAQSIWIVNRDGTGLHEINHVTSYQNLGGFSPDGSKIVFDAGKRSFKGETNVYVMNADGTGVVQLTTGSGYSGNSTWGK